MHDMRQPSPRSNGHHEAPAANGTAPPAAFTRRYAQLSAAHEALLTRPNVPEPLGHGVFTRYAHPVLTAAHTPLFWRYDLDHERNPYALERLGINAVFNAGAIRWQGRLLVMARVEGHDRKSFFGIAESPTGIDQFTFWDRPVVIPETDRPDVNVYDMRLTAHEDSWIYGVFCTERRDAQAPPSDLSAAEAQCGLVRTRDFKTWERLPDLRTPSPQQRNVVLHPEFVDGQYGFYTRPQDGFIDAGSGGGIGWGTCPDITNAVLEREVIVDPRAYHTIKETKNGQGPPPLKTDVGWLHLAHGVRHTAAGLRYVLYLFVTDLHEPWRITHAPGGYLIAPEGGERVGDVSNVAFSNGWVVDPDGLVHIYYGGSDTRLYVATAPLAHLIDYALHTPPDAGRSAACVAQRLALIDHNLQVMPHLDRP